MPILPLYNKDLEDRPPLYQTKSRVVCPHPRTREVVFHYMKFIPIRQASGLFVFDENCTVREAAKIAHRALAGHIHSRSLRNNHGDYIHEDIHVYKDNFKLVANENLKVSDYFAPEEIIVISNGYCCDMSRVRWTAWFVALSWVCLLYLAFVNIWP